MARCPVIDTVFSELRIGLQPPRCQYARCPLNDGCWTLQSIATTTCLILKLAGQIGEQCRPKEAPDAH